MNKRVLAINIMIAAWLLNAPMLHIRLLNGQITNFSIINSIQTDYAEHKFLTPILLIDSIEGKF